MIDTKELRRWNYVDVLSPPNPVRIPLERYQIIQEIRQGFVHTHSIHIPLFECEKLWKNSIRDISPIPIAEDWLFNLGFIEEGFDEEGTWYDIYIGEDRLTINIEKGVLMIGNIYNWFIPPADYKYIHQLQNLYVALTGEELKLKGDE